MSADHVMVVDAIIVEREFDDAREAAAFANALAMLPIVECVERVRGHVAVTFMPDVREPQAEQVAQQYGCRRMP